MTMRTTMVALSTVLAGCGTTVGPADSGTDSARDAGSIDVPLQSDVSVLVDDATGRDDLIVNAQGLATLEGVTVHLRLQNTAIGHIDAEAVVVVRGGSFTVRWPAAFDRNLYGMIVNLYADVDYDGQCTTADIAWTAFANNDFHAGQPVVVDASQADAGSNGSVCDVFR